MPGIDRLACRQVNQAGSQRVNLHQLELFYYVAEHGGISRAVRWIPYGIQQPAVSIQMLALEESLGTKLFERQPFRLTADGQELWQAIAPFFSSIQGVAERIRRKHAPVFRLASSELILREYLPPVLEQVRRAHPTIRFRLRSGYQAELEALLLEGLADLAILSLESKPKPGLREVPIVELPLVLLVPQEHEVRSAADLWRRREIPYPLIALPEQESITRVFFRGLRAMRLDWPLALEASSTDLLLQYVVNGYGLGVTVDVPGARLDARVRAVALPGFDPVRISVVHPEPGDALHQVFADAIRLRAQTLWPERVQPVTPKRRKR